MLVHVTDPYDENEELFCDGLFLFDTIWIDERVVDSPEKLPPGAGGEDWYSYGQNHRVKNGYIRREFSESVWVIKFNSMIDFAEFVNKYGSFEIDTSIFEGVAMEISFPEYNSDCYCC